MRRPGCNAFALMPQITGNGSSGWLSGVARWRGSSGTMT